MLFNTLDFMIFLPIVFGLYWIIPSGKVKWQNILLMLASYYFYGCWDWRFLFLLAFSTWLDYFTGLKIHDSTSQKWRKTWLLISVCTNLGFLGFFKYYNFFLDSFVQLLEGFGVQAHYSSLQIILPVGISFYTFHGLSYVFDIYNRRIVPTRNAIDYSLFVSFFPLLVAGPIERATHLLPQVERPRLFSYGKAVDGMRQILWGLFKKMVIADGCAEYANIIFDAPEQYNGATLVIGALLFTFQIYGDFSGYSDIALGTARLFGFELLRNFAYPYFSRDIAEFWRRWHISLSSWFKDYLYIPLGGSRGGKWMQVRNTFIIFTVSGFWHGANWTFVVWGALNALYFLPLLLIGKNRSNMDIAGANGWLPSPREALGMITTFALTVFAWIFFRAQDVVHAVDYIRGIFSGDLFARPQVFPTVVFACIVFFTLVEWVGRRDDFALRSFGLQWPRFLRWTFYYAIVVSIFLLSGKEQEFIYFQF
jgi:alginate O-acetyltransferase complex protein AlgI